MKNKAFSILLVLFILISFVGSALVVPIKASADSLDPWYVNDNFYNFYYKDGTGLLGNILKWSSAIGGAELRPQSELWSGTGDSYVYNSSTTNYYTPISVSNQDYYYDIYNPVTNTYNTVNYTNLTYDPTYNSYYYDYEYNNYEYNTYVSYSDTYVTYNYICPEDPNQNKFFEIYFVLPDGRNSFNLTKDDLKGIVFSYDVDVYDVGQVGSTIGLWHLDGNLKNEIDGSIGIINNSSFVESYFSGGLKINYNTSIDFNISDLPSDWTIDFILYYSGPGSYDRKYDSIYSSRILTVLGHNLTIYNENFKIDRFNFSNAYIGSDNDGYHFCSLNSNGDFYVDGVLKSNNFFNHYFRLNNNFLFDSYFNYQVSSTSSSPGYTDYGSFYMGNSYCSPSTFYIPSSLQNYFSAHYADNTPIYSVNEATYTIYNYLNHLGNCILDEVRLSEGILYNGNYVPRNEPFDSGIGFVVPDNPVEQNIYMQSFVKPSAWQFGGIRNPNPANGEAYFALDGNVVISAQQYLNGIWQEIPSAIYLDGSFHNLLGYDLTSLVYFGGYGSSGSVYDVDLSTTNNYLKQIRDTLVAFFGLYTINNLPSDQEASEFSWWDLLLPLVFLVFLLLFLLSVFNSLIAFITFLVNLISIEASSSGIQEDFVLAFQWLRGETENPFYLIGSLTCWDFMVILFEIFFIGLVFAVIRKNVENLSIPNFRKR